MKKCLVSGSFDPITTGHLDIIKKACWEFDQVIVGVFNNEQKTYTFDLNLRVELCKIATEDLSNVLVLGDSGMVFEFCKRHNIDAIIRGFRNSTDYSYETEMAQFNYNHCGVMTYLLPAKEDAFDISSSAVRKLIFENDLTEENKFEEITKYLPKKVWAEIRRIKNA